MPLIALTGGIASGKSTIARRLAEHGAEVIDADAVVRELQRAGSPVLADIVAAFGDDLLDDDGELRRPELGARVFGKPDELARLNAIVHPAVKIETERRFRQALAADPSAVVVYDVPLLVEARPGDAWDLIVVASAPEGERIRRLVELRGLDHAAAVQRIRSQVSEEKRRAIADIVIDTGGSLENTLEQTDALWRRLAAEATPR